MHGSVKFIDRKCSLSSDLQTIVSLLLTMPFEIISVINNSIEPVNVAKNDKVQIRTVDVHFDHSRSAIENYSPKHFQDNMDDIDNTDLIQVNEEGLTATTLSKIKDIRDTVIDEVMIIMNSLSKLCVKVTFGIKVRIEIF